ncbi:MAG: UDP-N-acetylmuramate--L-alanine ligase [Hydrotalea sp.]|nr:UDP-N-acetylmuramate--L-alanine ligase [Hydrotalea sp.]
MPAQKSSDITTRPLGTIYFVGIGGIGMSAIAEVMYDLGYKVAGSDSGENANVLRLKKKGIVIHLGHDAKNIIASNDSNNGNGIDTMVVSTAIKKDNPEYVQAQALNIPIVHRADMLATLMRLKKSVAVSGTHGKTTTTSLIAHIFITAGLDPVVISGGIINNYQSNAKLGQGDWLIAEADESDGSFLLLPASVAVVTNIDPEHLDHYGDFATVKTAFYDFMRRVPVDGFAVACLDHPVVAELVKKIKERKIISYGLAPGAAARLENIRFDNRGALFDLWLNKKCETAIRLPLFGNHNVSNAAAAITVARAVGIDWRDIRAALESFQGVKRRFTLTGVVQGKDKKNISVIDDYAHHPAEIEAVLSAARFALEGAGHAGRLVVVVEPHRYTRLRDLFDDFCASLLKTDLLFVADVYRAGEQPIDGATGDSLLAAIKKSGHPYAEKMSSPQGLAKQLAAVVQPNDMILCLGAGDVSKWANALPAELEKLL